MIPGSPLHLTTAQYCSKKDTAPHYFPCDPDGASLSNSDRSPPRVPDIGFNAHP